VVECRCKGSDLLDVPNNLPPGVQALWVRLIANAYRLLLVTLSARYLAQKRWIFVLCLLGACEMTETDVPLQLLKSSGWWRSTSVRHSSSAFIHVADVSSIN
jgi:hypothetical protein